MKCADVRGRIEGGGDDFRMREHLEACTACTEYQSLQTWSAQVVEAARIEVKPPLMSEVWASIHRASAVAWDSALTRSFRRLLPYMLALTALLLLVAVWQPLGGVSPAAPEPRITNLLTGLDNPPVAAVLSASMNPRSTSDLLGVNH